MRICSSAMSTTWFVAAALLVALVQGDCIAGLYGKCGTLDPPFCSTHCVCTGLDHNFTPFASACSLEGMVGTAVFAWARASAYNEGTAALNLSVSSVEVFGNSTNNSLSFATTVAVKSSRALVNSSVDFKQSAVPVANFDFNIGAMPCRLVMGLHTWSAALLEGTASWAGGPGMDPAVFAVDALIRNFSRGEDAPWELLASDVPTHVPLKFAARQCQGVDLAFRSRLHIPGVPAATCAELSAAMFLPFAVAPESGRMLSEDPAFREAGVVNGSAVYNVTVLWGESHNLGGCDNATYTLTVVSIEAAYRVSERFLLPGAANTTAVHAWTAAHVPVVRGVTYEAILGVETCAGAGFEVGACVVVE